MARDAAQTRVCVSCRQLVPPNGAVPTPSASLGVGVGEMLGDVEGDAEPHRTGDDRACRYERQARPTDPGGLLLAPIYDY